MRDTVTKVQEMDLQSRFTRASLTESTAYGPSVTPDNRFPRIPSGLGAEEGTRLLISGDSVWSRCWERDETVGFGRFRMVSVLEEGRDCWLPGNPRGLGAGRGTRLSVSGESVWSRCLERDETAGFRGFRVVSVPKEGRDCWFQGILCGLGA